MVQRSNYVHRFLVSSALCIAGAAPSLAQRYEPQAFAAELLAEGGAADARSATLELEPFLERHFLSLPIGLYDVRVHERAIDAHEAAQRMQEACLALVDTQTAFLAWLEPAGELERQWLEDAKTLRGWIAAWKTGVLTATARDAERPRALLEALDAGATIREAAERFAQLMRSGTPLGLERAPASEKLILAPARRDFLRLVSFGGWLFPDLQSVFWDPSVTTWTQCTIQDYAVLALEYAAAGTQPGEVGKALSMDYRYESGLEQQVSQLAAAALVSRYYGGNLPRSIRDGLAVNLVIDLYGRCDTRVDGDLRERETAAREVFIPGGASEGGVLPKVDANSRWRQGGDEHRYANLLRAAQKEGAAQVKRTKDKLRHFQLVDDSGARRTAVTGPYLGSAGADLELPERAFQGDFVEFLRAYQTCFLHWLRSDGAGSGKKSAEGFASLLRRAAQIEDASQLEEVLAELFRAGSLSSAELSRDDLEGRFLTWLSKQR